MQKTILRTFFITFFLLFAISKSYAAVDIELRDDKTNQVISVIINSNEAPLAGVGIPIIFSNNLKIEQIQKGDYCGFFFNREILNDKIDLECFNAESTVMNGEVAKIEYNSESPDYFFYVHEAQTDVGNEQLGNIIDINKPKSREENEITIKEVEPLNFFKDNLFNIILGIGLLIGIATILVALNIKSKSKKPATEEVKA